MIIRDEYSYLIRRETPRTYYVAVTPPFSVGVTELSPLDVVDTTRLVFSPETDQEIYFPNIYVKEEDIPYRWSCQDCYMACGDRSAFVTDWEKIKDLSRGEPSYKQREQISEHAKQHRIIWSWVRGLEKK